MQNHHFDFIIRGGTTVTADGPTLSDIGISDGRIAAIGADVPGSSDTVIDATGKLVLPGGVGTWVRRRHQLPCLFSSLFAVGDGAYGPVDLLVLRVPNRCPHGNRKQYDPCENGPETPFDERGRKLLYGIGICF